MRGEIDPVHFKCEGVDFMIVKFAIGQHIDVVCMCDKSSPGRSRKLIGKDPPGSKSGRIPGRFVP